MANPANRRLERKVVRVLGGAFMAVFGCTAAPAFGQSKIAQAYPAKPIRILVPNAPGGGIDILARLLAQKMSGWSSYPVVVDNRSGASGAIAMQIVAQSPADGYTLLIGGNQVVVASPLKMVPFDTRNAYAPIVQMTSSPYVLVVSPSLPVNSVKELISYAKSKAGTLNYGSAGNGSLTRLGTELFKSMAGIDMVHVPYKGLSPAMVDLMAGRIEVLFVTSVSVIPNLQTGKLKALAVTSAERMRALPELPTVADAGVPGFELNVAYGLYAPAGTPAAVLSAINQAVAQVMNLPEVKTKLAADGAEFMKPNSPAEFKAIFEKDVARWERFFKTSGLPVDSFR